MKRALSVTSPDHSMGLGVYLGLALLGAADVLKLNRDNSIYAAFPEVMGDVWATTLVIFAGGAFWSAVAAKKSRNPDYNLRMEMIFCWGLFINISYFLYVIVPNFGATRFTTVLFALMFALGSLARSIQIAVDRRRVHKARANPNTDSVQVLADIRDEPERS